MNAIVRNTSRTSMINKFAELEKERIEWESNEQKAAHERLYQIIARTYKLYDGATLADIKAVAAKGKIKVTKATTGALLAAKLVFGNEDTKRNSAISKVLKAAKAQKLTAEEVPDWIKKNGGIERIRLNKQRAKNISKAQNGRSIARSETAVKYTISAEMNFEIPLDDEGFSVLLCRKNPERGHDVFYALNDKSAELGSNCHQTLCH
ncbi:hypothetical protein [Metarhizobium album]|nr:hypothetical protein [Rhizobium album]